MRPRRAAGMEARPNGHEIEATVPLAEMFGYATQLRTLSRGGATFTMAFDHYEPVPTSKVEEIVAQRTRERDARARA